MDAIMNASDFEFKVLKGLFDCGVVLGTGIRIGAAVSGGADSISLLYSLASILKDRAEKLAQPFPLEVITVNHYMRPEEETCGDVKFVVDCCSYLRKRGFDVNCTVMELAPGAIGKVARVRKAGSEEAARFLRYGAFDKFIEDKKLDFLCLAHNKNDNLETILMRFLQGSSVDACGGILMRRGKFIRPLLGISRNEIEGYLNCLGQGWCNDKTNNDTNYLRNNIRHNLIPFLNEKFNGWDKAVTAGAEKAVEDAEVISHVVDSFTVWADEGKVDSGRDAWLEVGKLGDGVEAGGGVTASGAGGVEASGGITASGAEPKNVVFNRSDFMRALPGVQRRILIKAFNMAGEWGRISNTFLNDVIHSFSCCEGQEFSKFYGGIEISAKKNHVFVKKYIKKDTDLVFFDIIEEDGVYDFPFGRLSVTFSDFTVFVSINGYNSVFNGSYPICVHNGQIGDEIQCSDGKMKKVADIYSDWHVANSDKKMIPLISCFENGYDKCKCILAAFLGYKDWIVK